MKHAKQCRVDVLSVARLAALLLCGLLAASVAYAQEGRVVREVVHSPSLEKSVTGESPDRHVSIYLPPAYDSARDKRYPVVYLLHGIADTDETWTTANFVNIRELMNRGIAEGRFGEMIVVMPDEQPKLLGSFYTNSSVTGNWEDFTVKELVSYVDSKYRTLAQAESRGLAGHSMGGYGAIKLGMKHPDVFSVVYAMNPAVLGWSGDVSIQNPAFTSVLGKKSYDELFKDGFYPAAIVAVAQSFSPNPNRPPFYVDLPFALVDGKLQPAEPAFSEWEANFPINMIKQYKSNLQKLKGLRFDSGYSDEFTHIPPTSRALSNALTSLGIEHTFEEYNGDHRNRLPGRTGRISTEVMPYFWLLLEHQKSR